MVIEYGLRPDTVRYQTRVHSSLVTFTFSVFAGFFLQDQETAHFVQNSADLIRNTSHLNRKENYSVSKPSSRHDPSICSRHSTCSGYSLRTEHFLMAQLLSTFSLPQLSLLLLYTHQVYAIPAPNPHSKLTGRSFEQLFNSIFTYI